MLDHIQARHSIFGSEVRDVRVKITMIIVTIMIIIMILTMRIIIVSIIVIIIQLLSDLNLDEETTVVLENGWQVTTRIANINGLEIEKEASERKKPSLRYAHICAYAFIGFSVIWQRASLLL